MKLSVPVTIAGDLELSLAEIEHMTQMPRDEIARRFLESFLLEAWSDCKARAALKRRFAQIFPETSGSWPVDVLFGEGSIKKTLPDGRRAA